ncbi:4-hydroxy-3-methylbut-2-en-1-yl diphosphate synthase [Ruegeria sp. ANG-R]|uniref:helix-turn-helix domain-containing protein n=1 Tax=Ruegeria sp. ANG-R TaxID=1577903 RepID=UPI00057E32D5|nr:helix-turn-helix domain-containing protein [Ruegeria sp. ANG-R]KIC43032.1 4-hydroxy-3-methylbut-2-en-1-yl diphosphate synthase [Ruegeria sp. ANG-R]
MIGRRSQRDSEEDMDVRPKGFDDYEVRLGDVMRGERATMGKSLLDVQRELRIKANYIAAIENADPDAFDTPGFIAGYVRSYARYLGMNPDETFSTFCQESGFEVAHGMSAEASVVKKPQGGLPTRGPMGRDPFISPSTPYIPGRESVVSQIEPRAIGSTLVLLAVIGGIGYGGWSVLNRIQQVQVSPVEQAPVVLTDLDPLDAAQTRPERDQLASAGAPSPEALDRLYRPQALDVPVLVARDAPISTLDPRNVGTFRAPEPPQIQVTEVHTVERPALPQVVEKLDTTLKIVAVNPSWMRVTAADGSVIFEGTLGTVEQGSTFEVPLTEEPPQLRAGASGSVYFSMNGEHFGPVGAPGTVTKGVVLSKDAVAESYAVADLEAEQNRALKQLVAELQTEATEAPAE